MIYRGAGTRREGTFILEWPVRLQITCPPNEAILAHLQQVWSALLSCGLLTVVTRPRAQMHPGEACWVGGAMQRMRSKSARKWARGEGGGRNERWEWGRVEKSRYIFCILPESGPLMTLSWIEVEERHLLRNVICENSRYGQKTADFILCC